MATLVRNVWVEGRFYGPDHGNADDVPAEYVAQIPDDCWSSAPDTDEPAEVQRYEVLARADALGLDADRRWSTKRLLAAIAKAEEPTTDAV